MKHWFSLTVDRNMSSPDTLTVDVILFRRFWFWFTLGFAISLSQVKFLRNGDMAPCDEVIEPDDWRQQPLRPDGSAW